MAMVSVELVLGLIGLVVVVGFFGNFLFEKLHIPDVLVLLGCGILIGRWLTPETQALVASFAPYFGAVAIIMILFEGGLALDLKHIAGQFGSAMFLPAATFTLSFAGIAWAAMSWLGWSLWPSLMFGAIIGCTSSAIVIPTAQRSRAPKEIKALVMMESVLSDTLAIVVLVALLDLELGLVMNASTPLQRFAHDIMVALAVALPVGLLWLNILEWTKGRGLSYLWTFALLVLVYAWVNTLHASGALAVFFMALLIGNSRYLPTWLVWGRILGSQALIETTAGDTVKWFHTELTFLVRSFFFVYIGLLFRPEYIQGAYLWTMLGFTAVLAAARITGVALMQHAETPLSRPLIWAFMPRGLVSAVLATMPWMYGIPGTDRFLVYTIPIIISTNVIMTLWVVVWEWRYGHTSKETPA